MQAWRLRVTSVWLKAHDYRYLVVSRQRQRPFDEDAAVLVIELPNQQVRVQRVYNEASGEVEPSCHSLLRAEKERAIQNQFSVRFEAALQALVNECHRDPVEKVE